MKKYIALLLTLSVIAILAGCKEKEPVPAALIAPEITSIDIVHIRGGQQSELEIRGTEVDTFRAWVSELKYKHRQFKEGESPGDADGGEVYEFSFPEKEDSSFSYYIGGPDNCYLIINGEWYLVSNPATPPISD